MRNAVKESDSVYDKLKSIGSVFLKSREVSEHEAVARLCGLPLRSSNTNVVFVPTGLPENRTRIFKPFYEINSLSDEDTNVFATNMIDRYQNRPKELNDCCLADFVANFCSSRSGNKIKKKHT